MIKMDDFKPEIGILKYQNKTEKQDVIEEATSKIYREDTGLNVDKTQRKINRKRTLECDICGQSFTNKRSLNSHIACHLEEESNDLTCRDCGRSFTRLCDLKKHEHTHKHETGKVKCDICGKLYSSRSSLYYHKKIHVDVKSYICSICGKSFSRQEHIDRHYLSHSGEKPFKCNTCGKSFTEKKSLRLHSYTHTGEDPHFRCEICKKGYFRKFLFNRHMRNAHGTKQKKVGNKYHQTTVEIVPEKSATCVVCGRSFCDSRSLKRHLQIHTGEKLLDCEICKKSFVSSYVLKRHMGRKHNPDQETECSECNRVFKTASGLKRHILRDHEKVGTWDKCKLCDKKVYKSGALRLHYLKKHNLTEIPKDVEKETQLPSEIKKESELPNDTMKETELPCEVKKESELQNDISKETETSTEVMRETIKTEVEVTVHVKDGGENMEINSKQSEFDQAPEHFEEDSVYVKIEACDSDNVYS